MSAQFEAGDGEDLLGARGQVGTEDHAQERALLLETEALSKRDGLVILRQEIPEPGEAREFGQEFLNHSLCRLGILRDARSQIVFLASGTRKKISIVLLGERKDFGQCVENAGAIRAKGLRIELKERFIERCIR